MHAGVAQHELGEVRLRLGDLEGAEVAFGRAQELGEDPQPGLALLRLAQGDPAPRLSSIGRSLEGAAFDGFARARMLAAQAEIAAAAADAERATGGPGRAQRDRRTAPLSRGARGERMGGRAGRPRWRTIPGPRRGTCARRASGGARSSAPYETAKAEVALAEAELRRGDVDDAAAELRCARAAFERLGANGGCASGGRPGGTAPARGVADPDRPDVPVHGHRRLDLVDRGDRRRRVGRPPPLARPDAPRVLRSITAARRSTTPATASSWRSPTRPRRWPPRSRSSGGSSSTGEPTGSRPRSGWGSTRRPRPTTGATTRALGVHTAARISALAGAGEILASAETLAEVPDVRTSERAHRAPEGHRRAGRRRRGRVARLTLGQPSRQNPALPDTARRPEAT